MRADTQTKNINYNQTHGMRPSQPPALLCKEARRERAVDSKCTDAKQRAQQSNRNTRNEDEEKR